MRLSRALVMAAAMALVATGVAAKREKKHAPEPPPAQSGQPIVPSIEDTARQLIGWDGAALRAKYGEPRLLRREPPAEVWQYTDGHCTMVLFLYEPKNGKGPAKVEFVRARMNAGYEDRADLCLSGAPATGPAAATPVGVPDNNLPPASPVILRGREDTGTPIYSPGDPPPPGR